MTWKPLTFVFIDDEINVQRDETPFRLIIGPKTRIPPPLFPLQCSSPCKTVFYHRGLCSLFLQKPHVEVNAWARYQEDKGFALPSGAPGQASVNQDTYPFSFSMKSHGRIHGFIQQIFRESQPFSWNKVPTLLNLIFHQKETADISTNNLIGYFQTLISNVEKLGLEVSLI